MWKRISIIVCILLFSSVLKAGEKVHLSFEEALSVAFKNNPRVISLNEQIIVYEKKEKEAFSGFLPQLNASIAYKRATANSPGQVGLNLPSSLSSMAGSLNEKRESSDSYNNYSLGVTFNQLVWD
ncbi:MAG: TolC family protein, partial [Deltaproteobacteria bacterium]|nr:TolC family protein [Deltaproteobacteria bacterium]